jgi:ribosomal protein L40E
MAIAYNTNFFNPNQFNNVVTLNYGDNNQVSYSLSTGGSITFSFSTDNPTSNMIAVITDVPFGQTPTTSVSGTYSDQLTLTANNWTDEWFYFNTGSTFSYSFNSSANVDFVILNDENFNNYPSSYSSIYENTSMQNATGMTVPSWSNGAVPSTDDYYLVWNNQNAYSVSVNLTVQYTRADVYNFSGALYQQQGIPSLGQTTVTVPSSGQWYFILYFDPWYSSASSTDVTYNAVFTPPAGTTIAPPIWAYIIPIVIIVLLVIIIVALLVSRKRTRQALQANPPPQGAPVPPGTAAPFQAPVQGQQPAAAAVPPPPPSDTSARTNCVSCGAPLSPGATFCSVCGKKQEGRQKGKSNVTTPAESTTCSTCGATLEPGQKFCEYCGTKIE